MIGLQKLKSHYTGSPLIVQKAYAAVPFQYRMGSQYRKTLKFLRESKGWSADQWHAYQTERLRRLLEHCQSRVPFYKASFQAYDIDLNANDLWAEFRKLPLIDKSQVMSDPEAFRASGFSANGTFRATTGGTTGKPMQVDYERTTYSVEWAYKVFFWGVALGYTPRSRKATFRHFETSNGYCQPNPIYNEMRFSPYHLGKEQLPDLVRSLKNYAPEFLHGYPSALDAVARYCLAEGVALPDVKGVILISENILPGQRERMAEAFGCKVYSFYGHAERAIFASMGPSLDAYYAHPAYGVTELINDAGTPVRDHGVMGELVGTGFVNGAMPLLRFRTGDFACWAGPIASSKANDTAPAMHMPALERIQGRWAQEHLIGRNGQRISLTSLNLHGDVYSRLRHFQYVQDAPGSVTLAIVPENTFTSADRAKLVTMMEQRLGDGFEVEIEVLETPRRTQSGKLQFLTQTFDSDLPNLK